MQRGRLVIRFSSLGDIVLTSALANELKNKFPEDPLYFVSQDIYKDLIEKKFPCSLIVKTPSKKLGLLSAFRWGWSLAKELHQEGKKIISLYDLHGTLKSFFFKWGFLLSSPHQILSYKTPKHTFKRWLSVLFSKDFLPPRWVYQEHLKLFPEASPGTLPQLISSQVQNKKSDNLRILIAPDARYWKKKWWIPHWEKFFQLAFEKYPEAEWTLAGHPNCLPQDLIDEISKNKKLNSMIGKTNLSELVDLCSEHDLAICHNSGLQHICEALGIPVLSLAGPIVKGFGFSPFLSQSAELSVNLACRPCTLHGGGKCRLKGEDFHACMRLITPEQVLVKLDSFHLARKST